MGFFDHVFYEFQLGCVFLVIAMGMEGGFYPTDQESLAWGFYNIFSDFSMT